MRYQAQGIAVVLAVIVFLVILPFLWQDEDLQIPKKANVNEQQATVPKVEDQSNIPVQAPEASQVPIPMVNFDPFPDSKEFPSIFQELKDKGLSKLSILPEYDPFGADRFADAFQGFSEDSRIVGGGSGGGGGGGGRGGGPIFAVPIGPSGGGGGGNGGGGNNGGGNGPGDGGGGVTEPPQVQVPEPSTYLLMAALLLVIAIKKKGFNAFVGFASTEQLAKSQPTQLVYRSLS